MLTEVNTWFKERFDNIYHTNECSNIEVKFIADTIITLSTDCEVWEMFAFTLHVIVCFFLKCVGKKQHCKILLVSYDKYIKYRKIALFITGTWWTIDIELVAEIILTSFIKRKDADVHYEVLALTEQIVLSQVSLCHFKHSAALGVTRLSPV